MKGELTQRRQAKPSAAAGSSVTAEVGGGGDDAAGPKRRKSTSASAEHMRQMAAASTEALQRPRKDRERFRRFIVDAVMQALPSRFLSLSPGIIGDMSPFVRTLFGHVG